MAENGSFDRLVTNLPSVERQSLLEKLKQQSDLSSDALYTPEPDGSGVSVDDKYRKLPWYMRLWYFIVSLFIGRSPERSYENALINQLGRAINAQHPGFFDYKNGILMPQFHNQLTTLKEAARFFYSGLETSVNRDRGAFYAYLASLEMTDIHSQLVEIADPEGFSLDFADLPDTRLRQTALNYMDNCMETISADEKKVMYANIRALYRLKELSAFLFDRVLAAFKNTPSLGGSVCAGGLVKGQLKALNNILFSLQETPPLSLLSSLFAFILNANNNKKNNNAETDGNNTENDTSSELQRLISKTEFSLAAIRDFNRQTPLTQILRCINRDMSLEPMDISGGEDWLIVYRTYWSKRIETNYDKYIMEKLRNALTKSLETFFEGRELIELENIRIERKPDAIAAPHPLCLSFLLSFYKNVFSTDANQFLRPILINGEFSKRDNRHDFMESYNILIKLDDMIKQFDQKLSPSGDLGRQFGQMSMEMLSPAVRHRKMTTLMEAVNSESQKIVSETGKALDIMVKVLRGVVMKSPDDQYDTLLNFTQLVGKGVTFINGLGAAIQKLETASKLLENILAVEAANA